MPDLKLKQIEIRNFLTARETTVQFPDSGLVLVRGYNKAAGGKFRSVGSGKTLLGEALSRTLLGVRGRYSEVGHFSRDGKGDTFVKLDCDFRGKPLQVELGFKCSELSKTGEGFRFTVDGQQVWRDKIHNTREELSKILSITPELAGWTVYIDGDLLEFNNLSQKSSVDLLMSALSQPPWTDYHKKASETVSKFRHDLAKDEAANEEVKNQVAESTTDLEHALRAVQAEDKAFKAQTTSWDRETSNINTALEREFSLLDQTEAEKVALKAEMKVLESKDAELAHQVEMQRNALQDQLDEKRTELTLSSSVSAKIEGKIERLNEDLEKMQSVPKNCPKCGKPWEAGHSEMEIIELKREISALTGSLQLSDAKTSKIEAAIKELDASVRKLHVELKALTQQSPFKACSLKYERLEQIAKASNKKINDLQITLESMKAGPDRSKLADATSLVEERKRIVAKNKKRLTESAGRLQQTTEAFAVASYWQEAFSPNGIPNMILREAVQPLNDTARRISNLMTGGTIQIVYDTKRELATGNEKAELIVRVENKLGAKRLEGNSKGEGGISNLIIAETLSEVGRVSSRIGYRWYDEVTALNQDDVVRRSILAYMRETAQRLGILIFIVSHHDDVANYADHVLVAEKGEAGTVFYWD
jgi:DNA repair exonuclease SbcCD ATPase subunit